ncbi:4-hydroxy-2-oxovalerate aldolase [Streptomyces sp. CBMA156]|uniref:4-hydroxy-2-oxovalerate aldolase n=1 Tax=Streptomyces sp. CBMA156 TaxID=1930280 RepID=UPI001661AA56|nr:4-hydroxy-2-oxovalerate aldolase [Streptomyces sp. CBMA156]MBD0672849.1 4-hydroxy-2-oxovalerate aldolase [Streptomyces sp. CBMA156]MBD0675800.1 4-hydroxy-2-oxovalerate aldolase [Streptomyces sp. CBMA156]
MTQLLDRPPSAPEVVLHDPTLRDGHHAVRHQLDADQLRAYARAADRAGVPVVEVGHGNGLGASSLQLGRARLSDDEMLTAVREELRNSRMAVFMAPGWGTGKDLRNAVKRGADVVRIAAHCSQADVAERHLGLLGDLGVEAQAVLLMSHMVSPEMLAEQCALLVAYGAHAVGIMDSAGHYLPADVTARITAIVDAVGEVPVIFHGHNNLGMAVANSVAAVEAGARVIDGCARGFGAGAGNTQLEVLAAVLERTGHPTGIDLSALLNAADIAQAQLMPAPPTIDSISVVSGLAGVFSGFRLPVLEASQDAGVDPVEVFFELGRRQVIAGQEDQIQAVVRDLQKAAPRTRGGE